MRRWLAPLWHRLPWLIVAGGAIYGLSDLRDPHVRWMGTGAELVGGGFAFLRAAQAEQRRRVYLQFFGRIGARGVRQP